MANEEQVRVLREGVEAWKRWREEHPDVRPDLSEAYLAGADLRGVGLWQANLGGACLREASLRGANLSGANFWHADLSGADLSGARLYEAKLSWANLSGADLSGAILSWTDLNTADLRHANLSGANLEGADLHLAKLSEANVSLAYLNGVNLSWADLSGVDFRGARVAYTVFSDVNLSDVKGLEAVVHKGPSTIGIDTVYASGGRIPEVFLRGCGVPDELIAYVRSLVVRAIEFYSCFISYSSKDQDFAGRLHTDLQAKGVRCWFAPEDLKIGDRVRQRLHEAIRVQDKLLLILSEHSVASDWVELEVEAALEKERRRDGQDVLFPVRVDGAVMTADEAWAAEIRRTRNIGDFSRWKDHDAYAAAFERLLRDLKAQRA